MSENSNAALAQVLQIARLNNIPKARTRCALFTVALFAFSALSRLL
jgi:hypothetical protein